MIFRVGEFFQLEDLQSNVSVSHFEPEHGGAPTSGNLRNFRVLNPPTGAMFFFFFAWLQVSIETIFNHPRSIV